MPREWPFTARWRGSPSACASSDAPLAPADVTGVLIDRQPVDWTALRARARTAAEREILGNLQTIDRLRADRERRAQSAPASGGSLFFSLLAALSALQTLGCFAVLLRSGLSGIGLGHRPFRVV